MVCLAGLPLAFMSGFPAPVAGPAVVKLPAGVTGAEIQQALVKTADSFQAEISHVEIDYFHPGFPHPTHRM